MDARTRAVTDWIADRLAGNPHVRRVVLFGSRARGDHAERSDIDLAVEAPTADARVWDDILATIDEAPTLLQIDVVRIETAPQALREAIEREGIDVRVVRT
jgi:predicted nucleotidyltransferase